MGEGFHEVLQSLNHRREGVAPISKGSRKLCKPLLFGRRRYGKAD